MKPSVFPQVLTLLLTAGLQAQAAMTLGQEKELLTGPHQTPLAIDEDELGFCGGVIFIEQEAPLPPVAPRGAFSINATFNANITAAQLAPFGSQPKPEKKSYCQKNRYKYQIGHSGDHI